MNAIPYARQWLDKNDIEEVIRVLKCDWITQGAKVKEFEEALCKYTGAKYAVAVANGTAALHIACYAARIGPGDEVITSPITFVASANCVLYCGGKPVFADIQKDTVNIDPQKIREEIGKKTRGIIPVHFSGHPCDLDEIHEIAKKHNLIVIEDAAHALGAEYKGSRIGSCQYSDMTIFSFHPVKLITTGEGGAVLTNRKDLYERLVLLRNHGITRDGDKFISNAKDKTKMMDVKEQSFFGQWYYEMQELGFNYRLTDFQCALGVSQMRNLDRFIKRRREIVCIYNDKMKNIKTIDLPSERKYVRSAWHLYTIKIKTSVKINEKRKQSFDQLRKRNIGVQVHYIPVYLQPHYASFLGYDKKCCPNAEDYYNRTITLPLYPRMKMSDIKYVVEAVKEVFS
ncbi:MAG: UDP-4-amino-4,6-dideoxy-N-acetyl-beta-L-altrosamine transaminase [Candidatus Omnitrophica bacterium]|nr:UDP-4-amino-4,6-dideoxy-N-acetyl-beta-L-altrosamine transaminase [Candidatus Omnitrophota bacterium]